MENLLFIALEAHNPERNHHPRYEIAVGRDLFLDWVVTLRFGRVGGGCRVERFGGESVEGLRSIIEERLARRMSARRRLGCEYKLVAMHSTASIEDVWFPGSLLACFDRASSSVAC